MPMKYQATKEFRQELETEKGAGVRFQYRVDRDTIREWCRGKNLNLNSTVRCSQLVFQAGTIIDFFGHCHDI